MGDSGKKIREKQKVKKSFNDHSKFQLRFKSFLGFSAKKTILGWGWTGSLLRSRPQSNFLKDYFMDKL